MKVQSQYKITTFLCILFQVAFSADIQSLRHVSFQTGPITNSTIHSFYELARKGTPYRDIALRSFCNNSDHCDELCDGTKENCSFKAAEWCVNQDVVSGNNSDCILVRYSESYNDGGALACGAIGLPPVNGPKGEWTYFIDVPHSNITQH